MAIDRNLKTTFNKVAAEYDAVRPGYPDSCIEQILQYSDLRRGAKILELGCGTGQASREFLKRGFSLDCLDIGEELLAIAKRNLADQPAQFHLSSFEEFQGESSSYDLIFSATAFHWIDPEVRYTKAAHLLKPGGSLALFWLVDSRRPTAMRTEIDKVYQRVVPQEPDDKSRQSTFQKATNEIVNEVNLQSQKAVASVTLSAASTAAKEMQELSELKETPLFADIQKINIPWDKTFDCGTYLRLLNTFSFHRSKPDDVRNELLDGIATVINKHGGEITIHYKCVLLLARTTKS